MSPCSSVYEGNEHDILVLHITTHERDVVLAPSPRPAGEYRLCGPRLA